MIICSSLRDFISWGFTHIFTEERTLWLKAHIQDVLSQGILALLSWDSVTYSDSCGAAEASRLELGHISCLCVFGQASHFSEPPCPHLYKRGSNASPIGNFTEKLPAVKGGKRQGDGALGSALTYIVMHLRPTTSTPGKDRGETSSGVPGSHGISFLHSLSKDLLRHYCSCPGHSSNTPKSSHLGMYTGREHIPCAVSWATRLVSVVKPSLLSHSPLWLGGEGVVSAPITVRVHTHWEFTVF